MTRPLGLRREVLLFLPTAILLLILIASFNLLVYRNAIDEIEAERLDMARTLASRAASRLASGAPPSAERLKRLVPSASAVSVLDQAGHEVARTGTPWPLDLLTGLDLDAALDGTGQPLALGPETLGAPLVTAIARFERGGRGLSVQIDLPAERLAAHRGGLRRILWLNVLILGSLTILVLLFVRRLLAPYESLLEQARRVDPEHRDQEESAGEVDFLVGTFEKALAALDRRTLEETDDLALLEETLAPSLESGFMLLDRNGRVLAVNELGAELLGIERPEGATDLDILLAPHAALRALIGQAVAHGTTIQREECMITSEDGERVIGLTIHPLRRRDRKVRGFIVLYADLTVAHADERRAQLDRSLAQLGEVAAGVAHELRNGLATLKGYLGLIEHRPDEDRIEDYLQEMRIESDHLERVLNDFLSFAQPSSMRHEAVPLGELLERASRDPALAGVQIRITRKEPVPIVEGDAQLLERVVRNLLHNAAEAQREAGTDQPIHIEVGSDEVGAVIHIDDSGAGLSDDIRDRLFQPFASGRADGVGLGLALAHRITSLHRGSLDIADRPEGGVRATLRLPVRIDT